MRWHKKKNNVIKGDVIELHERFETRPIFSKDEGTNIYYEIIEKNSNDIAGYCDLRTGMNQELYYLGQIGYHVYPKYRGNHYAYEACLLLFEIAKKEYGMTEMLITCDPDNIPSRKTLEKLNGELVEITTVPEGVSIHLQKDQEKCIFKYQL